MRSRLSLALALVLSLAAVGCADGALTDLDAPAASAVAADVSVSDAAARSGSCPSLDVTVAGPGTLAPNAIGTYTVSMKQGCSFAYPSWSATNGATVLSRSGNTARIRAGSSTFSARARVVYNLDNLLSGSKTVSVSSGPVIAPLNVTLQNHNVGLRVTHGMSASEIDYFRIRLSKKTLQTGAISVSTRYSGSSFYYDDRGHLLSSNGPFLLSYTVEAIDMSGNVVARGSASGRGDTSF